MPGLSGDAVRTRQIQGKSKVAFPFAAGWGNFGSGFEGASYSRHGRVVCLQGLVTKSGTPASGNVIGTLPQGFRPTGRLVFAVTSGSAETRGRVDVFPNGEVQWISGGTGETDFTSLSGIAFVVD